MDDNCSNMNEGTFDSWNNYLVSIPADCQSLITLNINIRSMIKNFSHLEYIVSTSNRIIDIITITEANIKDKYKSFFELDNYTMFTNLREHRKGGGIILFIHNRLKFTPYQTKTINFESLMGTIECDNAYKTILCSIYRPPDGCKTSFINELNRTLGKFNNENIFMTGDINIDLKQQNNYKCTYLNCLSEKGLECGITQYTRVEKKGSKITKSCIDHIFTRCTGSYQVLPAVITVALADHYIIGCTIVYSQSTCTGRPPAFRKRIDNKQVILQLKQIDWTPTLNYQTPEDILNSIVNNFHTIYQSCTTYVKINEQNKRQNCKWANKEIKKMIQTRDRLLKIWLKTNDINDRILYNKYRNKTNKYINKTKNNFYYNEICSNFKNSKKVWTIINNLCGNLSNSIDTILLKYFDQNKCDLANRFANEFENNASNISNSCNMPILNSINYEITPSTTMRLKKASEEIVTKIISHINEKKSPGYDGIRASDLKYINKEITPVITHLINSCITTSQYPDKLKIGIIRPIFKKGNHTDYNNYRPITILSCIDKIVERYFGDELNKYLRNQHIINNTQFGFQRGRSTSQLLCQFTNEVNDHLHNRQHVLAVFIDFSKAFDTLQYNTLYKKLSQNGVQGPLLDWFKDYHKNRKTTVKISDTYSNHIFTHQGTAQGSILGPTEYLLYVNDMSNVLEEGSVYQFADDTCLLVSNTCLRKAECALQRSFDQLCRWAHDVGLTINAQKTKAMHIHSAHLRTGSDYEPTITAHLHDCLHSNNNPVCNCPKLEFVKNHMYIGLIIDHKFNWEPHINYICNKLRSILSKLYLLKYKIPYRTLRMLYLALADSIISYGLGSYGRTYKTYIEKIYKLQIRMLKTIVPINIKNKFKDNYTQLFKFCKVLPIEEKIKLSILKEENHHISQIVYKSRPKALRILTSTKKCILPKYRNCFGMRHWRYLLPKTINELPLDMQSVYLNCGYKKQLKRCFIKKLL